MAFWCRLERISIGETAKLCLWKRKTFIRIASRNITRSRTIAGGVRAARTRTQDTNPLCGDVIRLELQIDEQGTLKEVYFNGDGCCISQAAASMLVEKFDGKPVEDVKRFTAKDMLDLFGVRLTPNRQKCCLLSGGCCRRPSIRRCRATATPGAAATVPGRARHADAAAAAAAVRPRAVSARFSHSRPRGPRRRAAGLSRQRGHQPAAAAGDRRPCGRLPSNTTPTSIAASTCWPKRSTSSTRRAREKVRAFINAPGEPRRRQPRHHRANHLHFRHDALDQSGGAELGRRQPRAGDEILLTEMEHHSNLVPWYQLARADRRRGRHIPLTDDGRLRLDALDRLLDASGRSWSRWRPSRTCWARSTRSRKSSAAPTTSGAVVLVDGAQSVPHQQTDVQALDCDFLAFSGHKMLGPSGVGVLYGKRELLEAMPPFLGGGGMIKEVTLEGFEPLFLPGKFEAGTPPIVPAIGLGRGHRLPQCRRPGGHREHERRLTRRAHEVLGSVGGIRILGPAPEHKAGIVSFVSTGRPHAHDVAQVLDRYGVAIRAGHHCTMPLHQRFGRVGHRPGELLSLQHAGRNRQARRGPGAGQTRLPAEVAGQRGTAKGLTPGLGISGQKGGLDRNQLPANP